jgi:hypothetical protein
MVMVVLVLDPDPGEAPAEELLELAEDVDVVDRMDSKNASASFMLGSGSSLRR